MLFLVFSAGCGTIKEIPVEHRVEYEYRDSVRFKDSTVVVPVERVVDLVPPYDTLKLETSMAAAEAWVDTTTHTLKGKLENKQGIIYKYKDREKIVYRDSLVYQDVPVEVEVVKTVHPSYEPWLWLWGILSLAGLCFWVYKRFF